jgi:tetratricopeptide (TPR) repeat protein
MDVEAIRSTLEKERQVERDFVERARQSEKAPKGWPASLLLFHVGMWRERMHRSLRELAEGRPVTPPPPIEQQDEFNDAELAHGIGTPLTDAAGRSDHLLGEIIDLYGQVGEQPFQWYRARTTAEAVLGNSYTHPRAHISAYFRENGEAERATKLYEDAVTELRGASAPAIPMGAVLYDLARCRILDGDPDEALKVLEEALALRPEMRTNATTDGDLAALRDNPRFKELLRS